MCGSGQDSCPPSLVYLGACAPPAPHKSVGFRSPFWGRGARFNSGSPQRGGEEKGQGEKADFQPGEYLFAFTQAGKPRKSQI
jgi:hypothetical protein